MMINPFNYLFYKLTKLMYYTNESAEVYSPAAMGMIFAFNIWTILNIFVGDFNPYWLFPAFFTPFIAVTTIYWSSGRWEKIEEKYEDESEKQRIWGNWLVFLYVVATVALFIWSFRFIPVNK